MSCRRWWRRAPGGVGCSPVPQSRPLPAARRCATGEWSAAEVALAASVAAAVTGTAPDTAVAAAASALLPPRLAAAAAVAAAAFDADAVAVAVLQLFVRWRNARTRQLLPIPYCWKSV